MSLLFLLHFYMIYVATLHLSIAVSNELLSCLVAFIMFRDINTSHFVLGKNPILNS